MVDIDDTSHCPVAHDCEVCDGDLGALLTVATVETPVGVYCVTICETCEDNGSAPAAVGWAGAVDRVMRHCGHLGIDTEQMAAAMAAEGKGGVAVGSFDDALRALSRPITHRDGIAWHDAPLPRRWHRCSAQSTGSAGALSLVERCACGAIRLDGSRHPWMDRNSRRREMKA